MSSHLRHCPKHRKPLPCAHCALAAKPVVSVKETQEPTPITPAPERFGPLPLSEEAQQLRKEKEAERGRERRKKKREQLAAIKKALKTPIAEIKKADKDQRRLEDILRRNAKPDSMNRGMTMTGGQKLVTGGGSAQLEMIAAAAMQSEQLGASTDDGANWPDHDRRHVEPMGAGAEDLETVSSFVVKEGTDIDWGQALQNLFRSMFVEVEPETNHGYVCRLCRADVPSERRCLEHLEKIHGNQDEPGHDSRFGNVVGKEARRAKTRRTSGRPK